MKCDTSVPKSDTSRGQSPSDVGFASDTNSHGDRTPRNEETLLSSELTRVDESNVDSSMNSVGSVSALKELVCL